MIVSTILRFFHTYLPFCSPEDMGGLEMHGTGTSLGDPIEFGAAFEVLGSSRAGADLGAPSTPRNQHRDAFLAQLRYSGSGGADGGALQARGRILKPYRVVI